MAVRRKLLTVGDYVLSADCAVERKTARDFVNSIFDRRLFEQAQALKDAYPKPMIILEGDIGFELAQRQNPRAFFGAMLRLELEMQIPVMPTPSPKHTADMLHTLAKRLQRKRKEKIPIQHKPRLMTERDQQIYVIASLPGIGDELAGRLLSNFKIWNGSIGICKKYYVATCHCVLAIRTPAASCILARNVQQAILTTEYHMVSPNLLTFPRMS